MARIATQLLTPENRVNRAKLRLLDLSGGSAERLSQLRDTDKNSDIELRCELAYLVKLIETGGRRSIEVCIAGKPADTPRRRVFAKCTHVKDIDGSVLDIYTKVRAPQSWAIPFIVEKQPAARVRVKKETCHV